MLCSAGREFRVRRSASESVTDSPRFYCPIANLHLIISRVVQTRVLAAVTIGVLLAVVGCAANPTTESTGTQRLQETSQLIKDVKAFGKTIGIEPTEALTRTSQESAPLSMLWLWMQRVGTLALQQPMDIHMAIGFGAERERLKIEQVYRVEGYSVYYRQGNEFADARSAATLAFAEEPLVRRVKVILHEDLHGDQNFPQRWEIEEALVTPLGSLAALDYFRFTQDEKNLANALASFEEERALSRELLDLVSQAAKVFAQEQAEKGKQRILELLPAYRIYASHFESQVAGQHRPTVLEAKLSHDLAYFRYFDRVARLAEMTPLKTLIEDLRRLPADADHQSTDRYLESLAAKYSKGAL